MDAFSIVYTLHLLHITSFACAGVNGLPLFEKAQTVRHCPSLNCQLEVN